MIANPVLIRSLRDIAHGMNSASNQATLREAADLLERSKTITNGNPVAWLYDHPTMRHHAVITDKVRTLWLAAKPSHVEHYTIPLYEAKK